MSYLVIWTEITYGNNQSVISEIPSFRFFDEVQRAVEHRAYLRQRADDLSAAKRGWINDIHILKVEELP